MTNSYRRPAPGLAMSRRPMWMTRSSSSDDRDGECDLISEATNVLPVRDR